MNATDTPSSERSGRVRKEKFEGAISRVLCPQELADRLEAAADTSGASYSWIVRRAVEEYLDRTHPKEPT